MTQIRPQLGLAVPPVDVPMVDTSGRLTEAWRQYFERINVILGPQDDLYSVIGEGINTANELQALEGRVSLVEGRTGEQVDPAVVDSLRSEIEALRASVGALQAQRDEEEAKLDARIAAAAAQVEGTLLTFPRAIGALADKDDVGATEIRSGFQLLQTVSSVPSASEARAIIDTTNGGIYSDDGTNVYRLDPVKDVPALSADSDFDSTTYEVVLQADLGQCSDFSLTWFSNVVESFQSPAAGSDTYQGQWALYLSDTSKNQGDNPTPSAGETTKLFWEGASGGLTFQTIGMVVAVDANDLSDLIREKPASVGPTLAGGTVYAQLCLRRTAGTGAVKLVGTAPTPFSFTAIKVLV